MSKLKSVLQKKSVPVLSDTKVSELKSLPQKVCVLPLFVWFGFFKTNVQHWIRKRSETQVPEKDKRVLVA